MPAGGAASRWRRDRGSAAWPDGPRRRRARRTRWRRWAAAGLAAVAVLVTVGALRPVAAGGSGMPTVVMVRDVGAGQRLGRDDVAVAMRPDRQRPGSALASVDAAVGRVVTTPLTVHDVVTPERLLGPDVLAGQPDDRVAISVPVLDAASIGVRPGDHVDLYATGSGSRTATDVVVLAVHDAEESAGLGTGAPARVTLALDPAQATGVARGLSALEAGQSLVVAIRHRSGSAQ